ncbi:low-density lipoprotein receptor-related protein 3-like [Branchiostoma floridae]|uniref:Low-density lipoprotein receptor-related protein 3-like n=1 Tax=Branchiostoma floridae TaxID=7739 RepID=A0A9J7M2C6_BRAFL|nr:low-density lipoprotein receptor-related protein 3-like [Branchiostoma floridae]
MYCPGTCLAALLVLTLLVKGSSAFTVHLTDQCGKSINIKSHGGQVNSQAAVTYPANTDCELTLQADSGKHIYLRLERLDIPDGSGQNCGDSLRIYDGPSATGSVLGSPICGSSAGGEYESTGDAVTLKFTSDSDNQRGSGFLLVYAAFDSGSPCDNAEFECGNGRCISRDLRCDLADHCGDNTDESSSDLHANCANVAAVNGVTAAQSRGLGVGVIAAIAIAVILFVVLIVLAVCFFILHQQSSSASQGIDSEKQEPVLQTVAYTSNPAMAKPARVDEDNLAITELSESSSSLQPPPAQQPRPEEPELYTEQEATEEAAKPVYPDAVPGPPTYIPPRSLSPAASPARSITPVEQA